MRIFWGALVLIAGLAGLGYWGAGHDAVRIEDEVRVAAAGVATGAIHPMSVSVSGRDINLTGTADSQDELDEIVAALRAVEGRRVVRTGEVTILPRAVPYETAIAKGIDRTLALTGTAPSAAQAEAAEARGAAGATALSLASGAPEGWSRIMAAGTAALAALEEGSFALTGSKAILSGKARRPEQAKAAATALMDLPEGIEKIVAIDVMDPGVVSFELHYGADAGLSAFGTVPESLPPEDMAKLLGFDGISGETKATYGRDDALEAKLTALRPLLPDFDALTFRDENGLVTVTGTAQPGLDTAYLSGALIAALGDGAAVDVTAGEAPENWITRTNRATGRGEVASSGFWLPVYDFEISKQACNDAALQVQAGRSIQFVTGSAELDAASMAIINDMAGLLLHCTDKVGMTVQIGGHTDTEGDDNVNYRLSVARANAVRDALVTRGVPAGKMQALGFGETEPIADNDTEAGRAANRRTTFEWPE